MSNTSFVLRVEMTDAGLFYAGQHFVMSADITRFFNADDYNENGY